MIFHSCHSSEMNATLERKRMNSTKEEPFEQRNGKKAYSKDEILLLFGFECDTILYLDLLVLLMNPVLLYDVEEIYKNENTKNYDDGNANIHLFGFIGNSPTKQYVTRERENNRNYEGL